MLSFKGFVLEDAYNKILHKLTEETHYVTDTDSVDSHIVVHHDHIPGKTLTTTLIPKTNAKYHMIHHFGKVLEEKVNKRPSLKGLQQYIGDVSENSAVRNLISMHGLNDTHHTNLEKKSREVQHRASSMLPANVAEDRIEHGRIMAHAITEHLKTLYPDHEISQVHLTNKAGDISRATGGLHKDSDKENPSDITVGLTNPTTGETIYHGISLKSTETKGDIGFKNPTPRTMDKHLGTNSEKLWKQGLEELNNKLPVLQGLPGKSKSGELDRKQVVNDEDNKDLVSQIKKKTHRTVRDAMVNRINDILTKPDGSDSDEGHNKVKQFYAQHYMNTETTNTMPYSKVTAFGTKEKGISSKTEVPRESFINSLMKHPDSRIRVRPAGNDGVQVHIHDPETGSWHHAFTEQVKSSSGFGYSSPRHNIQPPGKSKLED